MTKRPSKADLTEAVATMRDVLGYFPAEVDSPKDAGVRRRVEGAVIGAELAAGEPVPRTPENR